MWQRLIGAFVVVAACAHPGVSAVPPECDGQKQRAASDSGAENKRAFVALPELKGESKSLGRSSAGHELTRIAPPRTDAKKQARPAIKKPVDLRARISAIGLTDDGKTVFAGGHEGQVFIGDSASGKVRSKFWIANNERIAWIQPAPDGSLFLVQRDHAEVVDVWSKLGEPLGEIPLGENLTALAISGNGTFAALGFDNGVALARLQEKTLYARLTAFPVVKAIAISNDETRVAFSALGEIILWNVKEDRVEWTLPAAQAVITALAFSADDAFLVAGDAGGAGMVYICDVNGRIVGDYSTRTAITALACPTPKEVIVANAESKELLILSLPDAQKTSSSLHPSQGAYSIYDQFALSRNGACGVWNREKSAMLAELKFWKGK